MTDLPGLGIGLGYRPAMHDAILANADEIDWLEIFTDDYTNRDDPLDDLRALRDRFALVPHGLEMSIGSDGPLDHAYLDAVARVADAVDAPWVSDHLCFTRQDGVEIGNLSPLLRTREKARSVAAKAQAVQDRLGRAFLLENITYYVDLPGDMSEAEFITEVFEHCDCGLLLDLNNLALNARNHGFDARACLDTLPLDRVVQVHLAGNSPFVETEGVVFDGHDAPVGDEVFDLLTHLTSRHPLKAAMIERDDRIPDDFGEIIADLRRTRTIMAGTRS